MFISYFDESGDDGYPKFASELFVLTSIYFHHSLWKKNYTKLSTIRKHLKDSFGLPIKQEFHTKEFVTDKDPYHGKYSASDRRNILIQFCKYAALLDFKTISVIIDKNKINREKYDVLKNALTYNVQRIENDLRLLKNESRFLIITDEGRVGKMTSTTREIQKINYIPSMYQGTYRKEIDCLIEDPLPKKSSQSYFIQLVDMICFIISLYAKQNLCRKKISWGNRISNVLNYGDEIELLNILKPKLNLKASSYNEYGIVYYPK
ncbi:MAG: DUF3800 domain-containing protein [Ginsengibacter sp.]